MGLWPQAGSGERGRLVERSSPRQPMSAVERMTVTIIALTVGLGQLGAKHPEFVASPWVPQCAWAGAIGVGVVVAWILARDRDPQSVVVRSSVVGRAVFVMTVAGLVGVTSWWLLARVVPEQVLERWGDVRVESGVVADLTELAGHKGCRTYIDVRTPSFVGTISRCIEPAFFHRLVTGQAVAVDVQSGAAGRQAGTFRFDLGPAPVAPGGPNL